MIAFVIRQSIRYPGVVVALAVTLIIYGLYVLTRASLDVFPEFSPSQVVIQTEGGPAVGTVVPTIPQLAERRQATGAAGEQVVRLASHEDIIARLKHEQREKEAHRIALLKIKERGLDMKLARVEHAFDGSRLVFYFTAESRVDFRELVRDLASEFRTRIE